MATPTTRYAQAPDGAYLAYQVYGQGPTALLYLPGWHSHLEVYWEQPIYASFMRLLARKFRVITFDKRGTGVSERRVGSVDFETMMDDVLTVLDAAGSARPVCGAMRSTAGVLALSSLLRIRTGSWLWCGGGPAPGRSPRLTIPGANAKKTSSRTTPLYAVRE